MNWLLIQIAATAYNALLMIGPIVLVGWWFHRRSELLVERLLDEGDQRDPQFWSKYNKVANAGCVPGVIALVVVYLAVFWVDANGHQILRAAEEMRRTSEGDD